MPRPPSTETVILHVACEVSSSSKSDHGLASNIGVGLAVTAGKVVWREFEVSRRAEVALSVQFDFDSIFCNSGSFDTDMPLTFTADADLDLVRVFGPA